MHKDALAMGNLQKYITLHIGTNLFKIIHESKFNNIGFWTNTSTTSRQKYIIQDIMTMTCTVTLSLHNSYKLVLILSKYGHLCINRDQGIALPGKTIEW